MHTLALPPRVAHVERLAGTHLDLAGGGGRIAEVGGRAADGLHLAPSTRMVGLARQLLAHLVTSTYQHDPVIRPRQGIVDCDCSELIDYLADRAAKQALRGVPVDPGHLEPRAWNYYTYLSAQPAIETAPAPARSLAWRKVARPADLAPGDVIAWENVGFQPGQNTGHVMLVAAAPSPVRQGGTLLGFDVPIIDSTSHGHGPGDTRPPGQTGLGSGTIFLPTDSGGTPTGFSWTPYGAPGALPPRPPTLAFGRLVD